MLEQRKYDQEISIQAYLSYRCQNPKHLQARATLEKHCTDRNITLVYDKTGTNAGESLIEFMDDLTIARCVFLFLSPEYFQSAYTLFELVSIYENGDLDNRFITLVRVSNDMVTYQQTAAYQFWQDNVAIQNELLRLLNASDADKVWERVKAAWDGVIFPFLDRLHGSLDQDDADKILNERVGAVRNAVVKAVEQEEQNLRNKVKQETKRILQNGPISVDQLNKELNMAADLDGIVDLLVDEYEVGHAIAILTRVIQEQKSKLLPAHSEKWEPCHYDAEQLCGWLLINSIDSVWWFNQQLKMQRTSKQAIINYSLNYQPYVEVIISRSLLQNARYRLDDLGAPQPASKDHNVVLFDAVSETACEMELLIPIYKDLFKSNNAPVKFDDLLDGIIKRAKSYKQVRNGKPIYYLVGQTTLEMLASRPWFTDAQQKLDGNLRFICCSVQPKNYDRSPAREDQELLLDQLALFLSLKS